jgi:hypothetical protein
MVGGGTMGSSTAQMRVIREFRRSPPATIGGWRSFIALPLERQQAPNDRASAGGAAR